MARKLINWTICSIDGNEVNRNDHICTDCFNKASRVESDLHCYITPAVKQKLCGLCGMKFTYEVFAGKEVEWFDDNQSSLEELE